MAVKLDVQTRAEVLQQKLDREISREHLRATGDYWIALVLMLVTVGSSAVAGLGGLAFGLKARPTAMIALVPGVIYVIASTMRFHSKSDWHYRKLYWLDGLKSRLLFELPTSPTADHIAAISKEHRDLIHRMNEQWEETLGFDFNQFRPENRKMNTADNQRGTNP